jgi:Actinobacteria/chloroflexi VLRF1 release factor
VENQTPGGALTGGRWLDISPERIVKWLYSFVEGHGGADIVPGAAAVRYVCADGAIAECHVPFPPLAPSAVLARGDAAPPGGNPRTPDGPEPPAAPSARDDVAERIAAHALTDRTVGVILVRLGGYAAGVFTGVPPRLAASKTGSRLVHGRSAAGGTSQQRFARRREKQAGEALSAAAAAAVAVLGGFAGQLDAVVLGGDRLALGRMRADQRLRPYFDLAVERFLTVPEPRLAVLRDTPRLFSAVRVRLIEPPRANAVAAR